jgi:ubiquinone/menaquinone biosynthesis C-methylase UbiE/uncharacterized protein YbaR (Trm112 family)
VSVATLEPDLLEILCCPACRGELRYAPQLAELSCGPCGFTYPIVDGIPVLFPLDVKARFEELFHRSWDSEARADVYDRFVEGAESPLDMHNHIGETRATLAVLGDLPPGRLLDCGCGNGRFFQHYPAHVTPVGFDASLNLLRICKKKGRATRLVCGEMEHLPFKDGVFDRAVSVRVIQHLKEQELAVTEIARVLRPGGEVTMHCYNELSSKAVVKHVRQGWLGRVLNAPFRALFRTLSPFAPWELAYDKYNSVPQVRRWLRRGGVRMTQVLGAGFGFNKWFMGGFLVAPWLERKRPKLLQAYLAASLRAEEAAGRIWPFNYFMEKFVMRGVKQSS